MKLRPGTWQLCIRRVHSRFGQTLEVVLAHRLHSVGVDLMQRSFEPMRKQVEEWQSSELTDVTAKGLIIGIE